jgi:hypothetical protein
MSDDFLLGDIDFNDFLSTDGEFGAGQPDVVDILIAEAAAELGQPAHAPTLTSIPVHTTELGDAITACVIRVDHNGRDSYQLYCVDDTAWALTGLFGLFVDALAEIRRWRRYVAAGGTLAAFEAAHPDGIRPDASAVAS